MTINLKTTFNSLLIISMIWILIESAFRKWFIPSLTVELFAVKYILLGLTYLFYFLYKPQLQKIVQPYQSFILLFTLWCLLLILYNPLNAPALVTTFGLINHLFFIPVILIIPEYFNSIKKIDKFIKVLAWISIPIYIVGIIQYYSPPDHFINQLANEEQGFAKVISFVRSNSIFSFVKNYNTYLLLVIPIFICRVFYLLENKKNIIFYSILILLGMLNMFMTASRLSIFLTLGFVLVIFGYIFIKIGQLRKSILVIFIVGTLVSFGLYYFNPTFKLSVDSFIKRVELAEAIADKGIEGGYSAKERLNDRLQIFKFSNEAGLLGLGIGTTYQGTGFFLTKKREDIKFEEEGERIVLELGVIGGILVILLRLFIFIYSLRILFKLKNIQYLLITLPFVLQLISPLFFLNSITFSYIDSFTYWTSFGFILAIKNIYTKKHFKS